MPTIPPDPFVDTGSLAIPAATVVPLRDGPTGLETLLLLRASGLSFAGGMWVWPGGRIDPGDASPVDDGEGTSSEAIENELTARRAAIREAAEEAGLELDPERLVWFSHWTPPAENPKRFRTFFFITVIEEDTEVRVDGGEILDHRWVSPAEALEARDEGRLGLTPPTAITLSQLGELASADEAVRTLGAGPPEFYSTRFASVTGGGAALYHGDVAYEGGDPERPGPRHRLWMLEDRWYYERTT